ncbi:dystroglycan-like [Dorcoceras hygrometricum]|uniref:Dystroglycan-like n=1 Tax=Dorcoceras hygrometricum TaxID=472368 RepID=A0A2Z7C5Z3_9LAMI|nr:dystroglycan-like [Dorcoceras hygrometricum]
MASSFITNALQVNFDSILGIQDNEGMVQMYRALEASVLRGFLGCPSVLYEQELEQFFDTAIVQDGDITCVVSGKYVAISETRFAGVFNFPTDGLTDLSEVPNDLVSQARFLFSNSSVPVQFSCKNRLMKYEFRLLNDILAKSITVKAGSFDAVTHERFLMMTAIHFGIKVKWRKIIFEVLKEMTDRTTKRAKGFAAQICVLLKGDPAVTLGEAKTFPPLKIISAKTVNTYVATNKTIDARGESDEPEVAKAAIVKKKSVSKKRSASTVIKDTYADLALISVAQDVVPIQVVEPISVVPTERPHDQKRKAPKRKMRLSTGSDDEIVEKESAVETVVVKQKGTTSVDDVETIIEQLVEPATEKEIDPELVEDVGQLPLDEESLSIDDLLKRIPGDMMLPSVFAAEPAKIKFSNGISITGVTDGDWFKENLPNIDIADKGKAPLVEPNTIKGHPAPVLKSLNGIAANEEQVLTWGETDSVQVALQRRLYIVAKYRELLLRKFLESHRANFSFGQPWLDMALQIIDLLSTAHSTAVQDLLTQKQAIQVEWTRPCCATLFEGAHMIEDFIYPGIIKPFSQHAGPVGSFNPCTALVPVGPLLGTETAIEQIVLPTTASPATDLSEQFAQLRASISQLSIKQIRTQSSIGNLQNHLLSRIDELEKASANARTQQDQDLRGLFKSVRQEVQIQKNALSFEVHEFRQGVRAQSGIFSTDLADIRKEVRDLSKEFDDKLADIRNDLLEFRVETQEQYATLSANLSELIAFVTKGRDDKKGQVGSSHGRGKPPPEDRSKPGSRDGGSSGSRSEPSRKRGSSGSKERDWRYWING